MLCHIEEWFGEKGLEAKEVILLREYFGGGIPYDPLELMVMGNSRIYEKGMEILLERTEG